VRRDTRKAAVLSNSWKPAAIKPPLCTITMLVFNSLTFPSASLLTLTLLHLSALRNHHIRCRPVQDAANILDLPDDIHAVDYPSERDVLSVQKRVGLAGDEELAAIRVWAGAVPISPHAHTEREGGGARGGTLPWKGSRAGRA